MKKITIKKITEPTKLSNLHQLDIDADNLEIYLIGREEYIDTEAEEEPGVEYAMSNRFIKNLNICHLNSKDGRNYKPILIHMKTNGGEWSEGMAIYDAIKAVPNKVTIVNYTHARSMSSIILQAADRRIMMPHSSFMFHRGTWAFSGTMQEVESNWEWDKKDDAIMVDIYVKQMVDKGKIFKTRKAARKWIQEQMMKRVDVFLTPEQTIRHGLADEVFTSWRNIRK